MFGWLISVAAKNVAAARGSRRTRARRCCANTWVVEPYGRDRQADGAKGNERQVPEIDVAHAVDDARGAGAEPFALEAALVGEDGGEAGEQHEYLGRVGEAEVAQREMRKPVVGDVIDEDEQQREPAEEIDPQVSIVGHARRAYWHSLPIQCHYNQNARPGPFRRSSNATCCSKFLRRQRSSATEAHARRCANRAVIYKLLGKIDLRWAPR